MSDTVLDLSRGKINIQTKDTYKPELDSKIVVYAHHTNDGKLTKSVSSQLENWNRLGWQIVVVDCSEDRNIEWPSYIDALIQRENIANDFGSWSVALNFLPEIQICKKVLLANSGMVGPFYPFDDLLKKFEDTSADVWGVTTSEEISWHIQSYWIGFSNRALFNPAILRFWKEVRHIENKTEFIIEYEIGFSTLIKNIGVSTEVVFPNEIFPECPNDPGLAYWSEFIDIGKPFLRRRYINRIGVDQVITKVLGYGMDAVEMVLEGSTENLNPEV